MTGSLGSLTSSGMTVLHLSTDLYDVTSLFSDQMSVCARAVKLYLRRHFL